MGKSARVGLLLVVAVVAACGEAPGEPATGRDLLYFQTPKGVAVLAAGATSSPEPTQGVPSTDWSSVVTGVRDGYKTQVQAVDARKGLTQWAKTIPGPHLQVKVVSERAEMVALTP